MQDYADLVAAARKLAKAAVTGELTLDPVKMDFNDRYNEDQAIQALAGCFVRGERIPKIEKDRTGFYQFVPQSN